MWLKADRAALATAALVGLSCWALWAPVTAHAGMPPAKQTAQQPAKPASVCPVRAHTTVRQIDLFDGPPADQAYLAPADPDRAPNLYPVREVYQQGRIVTIRCQYADGQVQDMPLATPVDQCRYREAGRQRTPTLVCR
jgi:hypothetical protein